MEIDVKLFLVVNGLILAAIIISTFTRQKRLQSGPSKLNMRSREMPKSDPVEAFREASSVSKVRELNVPFEFQGQSWDAYQVLQVPAGSGLEASEKGYYLLRQQGEEDQELLDRAMLELRRRLS